MLVLDHTEQAFEQKEENIKQVFHQARKSIPVKILFIENELIEYWNRNLKIYNNRIQSIRYRLFGGSFWLCISGIEPAQMHTQNSTPDESIKYLNTI